MEPFAGVLLRLEGERDARIAPEVPELALIGTEERCEHELVAVEPGPGEGDVWGAVRVERHDVRERPCGEETPDRIGDRGHHSRIRRRSFLEPEGSRVVEPGVEAVKNRHIL